MSYNKKEIDEMSRTKRMLLVCSALSVVFAVAWLVVPVPQSAVAGGGPGPTCTANCVNPHTVCDGLPRTCASCGGGNQAACSASSKVVWHAPSILGSDNSGTSDVCFPSVDCKSTYPC